MNRQELYLVFGGTLVDTRSNVLAQPSLVDLVGIYPDYADALSVWRARSQSSVDDAYVRYYIAPLHQLMSPDHAEEPRPAE